MSWRLDEDALARVLKVSGLAKLSVCVVSTNGVRLQGTHRLVRDWMGPPKTIVACQARGVAFYHQITVARDQSPLEASRTVWHECCHARQADRLMNESDMDLGNPRIVQANWLDEAVQRDGYSEQPGEIEARQWEHHAGLIAPCVKI